MKATRYGDPLGNDELDMGPVINKTQVGKMKALVDSALAAGAEAVILGCTEIALLVGDARAAVPLYDTTAIHAEAAVRWIMGEG